MFGRRERQYRALVDKIDDREAYKVIYDFYKNDFETITTLVQKERTTKSTFTKRLIDIFPHPETSFDLDRYAIFKEVLEGCLNAGYPYEYPNLEYEFIDIYEYAVAGLEYLRQFTDVEQKIDRLTSKKIWDRIIVVKTEYFLNKAVREIVSGGMERTKDFLDEVEQIARDNEVPVFSFWLIVKTIRLYLTAQNLEHASILSGELNEYDRVKTDPEARFLGYGLHGIIEAKRNNIEGSSTNLRQAERIHQKELYDKELCNESKEILQVIKNWHVTKRVIYDPLNLEKKQEGKTIYDPLKLEEVEYKPPKSKKRQKSEKKNTTYWILKNRDNSRLLHSRILQESMDSFETSSRKIERGDIVFLWQANTGPAIGIYGWGVAEEYIKDASGKITKNIQITYKKKLSDFIPYETMKSKKNLERLSNPYFRSRLNSELNYKEAFEIINLIPIESEKPPTPETPAVGIGEEEMHLSDDQQKIDTIEEEIVEEIKPPSGLTTTDTMIEQDMWTLEDQLGYKYYANVIRDLIVSPKTKPPLTIGIKAPWGAGKTSLMKKIQYLLDPEFEKETEQVKSLKSHLSFRQMLNILKDFKQDENLKYPTKYKSMKSRRPTVWFNAWKYQKSEQIWAGMAYCIISQITARMNPVEREEFLLKLSLKRIDPEKVRIKVQNFLFNKTLKIFLFYLPLILLTPFLSFVPKMAEIFGPNIGVKGTGLAVLASIANSVVLHLRNREEKFSGDFLDYVKEPNYEDRMGYLHLVESDLKKVIDLITTENEPLVVFIDDLDRCEPRNVADVIEALNLFLSGDYKNCIFVLGMDPVIVSTALEVANIKVIERLVTYTTINNSEPMGMKFMEKFIQLPITIPPPDETGRDKYLDSLIGKTLEDEQLIRDRTEDESPNKEEAEKMKRVEREKKIAEIRMKDYNKARDFNEFKTIRDKRFKEAVDEEEREIHQEAMLQEYSEKFEDDPILEKRLRDNAEFFSDNPRQMKRFINEFRLLSLISLAQSAETDNIPDDEAIAKFVVLTMKWPQCTDLLKKNTGSKRLLVYLEEEAEKVTKLKSQNTKLKKISSVIEAAGFKKGCWVDDPQLFEFLSKDKKLGEFSDSIFW